MKFPVLAIVFVASMLMAASCDEGNDPAPYNPSYLTIQPGIFQGGTQLFLGSTLSINDSTDVSIETVRFYVSHLQAVKADGSTVDLADYTFFDLREPSSVNRPDWRNQKFEIPAGNYTGLTFSLGLDSAQNYSDPSTFPQDNPLSAATGMYWTWATQYRFVMAEGRANQTGQVGSGDDQAYSYHPGGNHLYVEGLQLSQAFNVAAGGNTILELKVNTDAWFNGPGGSINPFVEFAAHDAPADQPLAAKFITNFASGLSL